MDKEEQKIREKEGDIVMYDISLNMERWPSILNMGVINVIFQETSKGVGSKI